MPITIRRIVGNSMLPTLCSGDIVVFKKSKTFTKGNIVLAVVGNRDVVKRIIHITPTSVILYGDNSEASTDSRQYGEVLIESIVGRLVFTIPLRRFTRR